MPLTPRQLRLIDELAKAVPFRAACRRLKVPIRTAARWKTLAEFRQAVREACRAKSAEGDDDALAAYPVAVRAMRRLLASRDESVRLRAAAAIMGHRQDVLTAQDLAAEVEQLRKQLNEDGGHGGAGKPEA